MVVLDVTCIIWDCMWRSEFIRFIYGVSQICVYGGLLLIHIQRESGIVFPYMLGSDIHGYSGDWTRRWTHLCVCRHCCVLGRVIMCVCYGLRNRMVCSNYKVERIVTGVLQTGFQPRILANPDLDYGFPTLIL